MKDIYQRIMNHFVTVETSQKQGGQLLETPDQSEDFRAAAYEIGKYVPQEDAIYGGYVVDPKDGNGKSLGIKGMHIWWAPEDITNRAGRGQALVSHGKAVQEITGLTGWHGHDGEANEAVVGRDKAFFDSVRDRTYQGGWIAPPKPFLDGKDVDGMPVHAEHLCKNKDVGAFAGTFTTNDSDTNPWWYLSSSEPSGSVASVFAIRLSDGSRAWANTDYEKVHVRPCRVELVI